MSHEIYGPTIEEKEKWAEEWKVKVAQNLEFLDNLPSSYKTSFIAAFLERLPSLHIYYVHNPKYMIWEAPWIQDAEDLREDGIPFISDKPDWYTGDPVVDGKSWAKEVADMHIIYSFAKGHPELRYNLSEQRWEYYL